MIRRMVGAMAFVGVVAAGSQAFAGAVILTGHDVLLHSGQNGFDNVALDFTRGAGTATEIAAASYDILLLRGFQGFVGTLGVNTLEGFGTVTVRDIADFGGPTGAADLTAALVGQDVVVIPSHENCGGCDLSSADADILELRRPEITAFFNAGGDIYANSSANDATFYNFLPPGAVASGLPIGGSSGFDCTPAGAAIGLRGGVSCPGPPSMINGFPTHNRFVGFDPAFTVFEVRGTEIITIGIREARIVEEGIVVDDAGDGTVPEPASLALMGVGLAAATAAARRRRRTKL